MRWKLPVAPEKNRTHVQTGDVGRVCPNALPLWGLLQTQWLPDYWNHTAFHISTNISSYPYNPLPADGRTTEDCLFLDVLVPKRIFDQNNKKGSEHEQLAPVLVWIHGGGQVSGEKAEYDASGLIQRSMNDEDGIIFVEINYRVSWSWERESRIKLTILKLGVFGFLAGNIKEDGIANLGLHDQRFALEWVAENIHLFGGDANQVTVMGESAGAGSIAHHITAYGGDKGPAPFQQAIVQSTGWVPHITEEQQKATREQFLSLLGVKTLEEARKLPSEKLIAVNTYQSYYTTPWGSFSYGEVVDGSYVPDTPAKLLLEDRFDHDVKVMIGRVENEGLLFTGPASNDPNALEKYVQDFVQTSNETAKYITDVLYPPIYDGSQGYTDPVQRWALFVGDWSLNCNGDYLRRAYDNETYSYQFNIPPALHAEDIPYTFYENGSTLGSIFFNRSVANTTVAFAIQDWITSFTLYGEPESELTPHFPEQGSEALLMDVRMDSIGLIHDRTDGPRCQFWQNFQYR